MGAEWNELIGWIDKLTYETPGVYDWESAMTDEFKSLGNEGYINGMIIKNRNTQKKWLIVHDKNRAQIIFKNGDKKTILQTYENFRDLFPKISIDPNPTPGTYYIIPGSDSEAYYICISRDRLVFGFKPPSIIMKWLKRDQRNCPANADSTLIAVRDQAIISRNSTIDDNQMANLYALIPILQNSDTENQERENSKAAISRPPINRGVDFVPGQYYTIEERSSSFRAYFICFDPKSPNKVGIFGTDKAAKILWYSSGNTVYRSNICIRVVVINDSTIGIKQATGNEPVDDDFKTVVSSIQENFIH